MNNDAQLLRVGDAIFVLNLKMLERNMGFSALIQRAAAETVDAIEELDILDDIEVLRDTLDDTSFARKLSKVKNASPIFKLGISKEAIVDLTKNTPELAGKFKYSEDGMQIRLDTKKSKIAFLKLLNDAFLHSELTQQWYDASAKDNITPVSYTHLDVYKRQYLRNLDLLISLRQQELDKLKSIKKALLEKMFV